MENIIEMREKRMNLVNQARDLVETAKKENRAMSADDEQQYKKIMEGVRDLKKTIDREEELINLENDLNKPAFEAQRPNPGNQEKIKSPRATEDYQNAFRQFVASGQFNNSLQVTEDTAGGFTVAPEQFVTELLKNVDDAVFIRQWARKFQVNGSNSLGAPTLDSNPNDFDWTSEVRTVQEDKNMKFGKRSLTPQPLTKLIKVSMKLLRASALGPDAIVRERMEYVFGLTHEKAFLLGNGVDQPLGVFAASSDGISANRDVSDGNTATAIKIDGLKSAKYSLKQQYHRNAKWLFHRDAVEQIDKEKDANGQYIWQPSVQMGEPDRLLNIPVYMSEYVPNTFTTGQYVGILGDFSVGYWIADSLGFGIQRLNELYAGNNQIGFIGRGETDGMPVLEEAFARIKLG